MAKDIIDPRVDRALELMGEALIILDDCDNHIGAARLAHAMDSLNTDPSKGPRD